MTHNVLLIVIYEQFRTLKILHHAVYVDLNYHFNLHNGRKSAENKYKFNILNL